MNQNPSAEQDRFHNELREMFFETQGGGGELHHIFGSKEKFKLLKEAGIKKAGEWFVILLHKSIHDDIKKYSFDAERGMFFQQVRQYESFFNKKCPVPDEIIVYYNAMLSKHYRLKVWP